MARSVLRRAPVAAGQWVGPFEADEGVVARQKSAWGGGSEMEYLRHN
jgi:hypothetical protein